MSEKKVFDFTERRKQSIEQKRRNFERVMFEELLGVDVVVDDDGGGYPLKLLDVSHQGCLFQMPYGPKVKQRFAAGDEVTLKVFFTKTSFLPVVVKIRHASEYVDQRGDVQWRCGGEFDTSLPSFTAFKTFIEFTYQYAEFSCRDSASHKVYFL